MKLRNEVCNTVLKSTCTFVLYIIIGPFLFYRSLQEHLLSQKTLVNVARSLSIPELIQTKVSDQDWLKFPCLTVLLLCM